MLVCPQCQFENPDANKFCQRCGISLTEVTCPSCDASVPTNVERCPHCGTVTGTVWRAILLSSPEQPSLAALQKQAEPSESDRFAAIAASTTTAQYLDAQQRYQLLEPLPDGTASPEGSEVRVLDCQPYQPTFLETLARCDISSPNEFGFKELSAPEDGSASLGCESQRTLTIDETLAAIPALAHPYILLQLQVHPSLPYIHDAWEQDGQVVLLLEDRSDLPLLSDVWSGKEVLPLQILHWLYQMTELWGVLQPHGYRQSLLELSNLRVDEDHLLCLQRLYLEKAERPLELKDLGRLWQLLFQMSQRTQPASLVALCRNLETGEVSALDPLRSQFESIANDLQPDSIPTPMPSEPPPLMNPAISNEDNDPTVELSPTFRTIDPQTASPQTAVTAVGNSIAASPPRLEMGSPEDDVIGGDGDDVPTVVLPMKLISIEDAGRSDVGRQRDHNEDYFSIQAEIRKVEGPPGRTLQVKGLYVLCDGMGGHAGGEVASALAVETLKKYFETHWQDQLPDEDSIREAIYLTNKAIYDLNQENARSGSGRMGTTLVLVLVQDTQAVVAHVGDSRLYRFSRRRGLEQITVDHEVGQREIQRGVEPAIAYARPDAYQLTQALGPRDENFVNPDVQFIELNEDLLLLLCSDGLTDNDLLETHWRTHLEPLLSSQTNLEQGVNQLIELANHYNGYDNITALVIRTKVRPNLEQLRR